MKKLGILLFISCLCFLTSCIDNDKRRETAENKLKIGMTTSEAEDVIGKPKIILHIIDSDTNSKREIWKDDHRDYPTNQLFFVNDSLVKIIWRQTNI